ncbi:MAG: hypothetical protein AAF658_08040, partial [Myxococcota bacterium]
AFFDAVGDLWVLWTEVGNPDFTSYIARYTTEFGFGTPMVVGEGSVTRFGYDFSDNGDGTLWWVENDGNTIELHIKDYDAQTGFEVGSEIVNPNPANTSSPTFAPPLVRRGPGGHVLAAWREADGGDNDLFVAIRDPRNEAFGAPQELDGSCGGFGCPIANSGANAAGQFAFVATSSDFQPDFYYYNGSSWLPRFDVDNFLIDRVSLIHVAPNGEALIGYERQNNSGIFSRNFNGIALGSARSIATSTSKLLSLIPEPNGDTIAVVQNGSNLLANTYDFSADAWGAATSVFTGNFDAALIRRDSSGNGIVSFRLDEGAGVFSASALQYEVSTGWASMPFPDLEASDDEVISVVPSMAPNGDAVVSWRENTLTRSGWFNVFQ